MGLVHDDQQILREEIHQCQRRLPGLAKIQMPRIVLDPAAESGLPHHLDVKVCPLGDPLGLDELVLGLKILHLLPHLGLNILTGPVDLLLRHHIVGGRPYHHMVKARVHPSGKLLHLADPVDLIAEPLDPDQVLAALRRIDLHRIPPDPEIAALQGQVIPRILDRYEIPDHLVPVLLHPGPQRNRHSLKLIRTSQSVNTGHTGHDHYVPSLRQRRRRRQPQLVDLIVDHRILCNIRIAGRYICLRLIVIIIRDKILHGVFRKEFLHFTVELSGKRLVMRNDQCRPVQGLDHIGHRKCLAGSGHAQQSLELISFLKPLHQVLNSLRLVACRLIFRMQYKMIHGNRVLSLIIASRCSLASHFIKPDEAINEVYHMIFIKNR